MGKGVFRWGWDGDGGRVTGTEDQGDMVIVELYLMYTLLLFVHLLL